MLDFIQDRRNNPIQIFIKLEFVIKILSLNSISSNMWQHPLLSED